MTRFDRRRFLQALSALGVSSPLGPAFAQLQPKPRFAADPFSLGVASGYPLPGGFVLWTRLAPVPVRLPLPPAEHQGSIYENQRASSRRYFATAASPRAAAE